MPTRDGIIELMPLETYRAKRDFARTPEPSRARLAMAPGASWCSVIGPHALHYDTRLEVNGVLVSWAVPKGRPWIPTRSGWPCAPKTTRSSTSTSRA